MPNFYDRHFRIPMFVWILLFRCFRGMDSLSILDVYYGFPFPPLVLAHPCHTRTVTSFAYPVIRVFKTSGPSHDILGRGLVLPSFHATGENKTLCTQSHFKSVLQIFLLLLIFLSEQGKHCLRNDEWKVVEREKRTSSSFSLKGKNRQPTRLIALGFKSAVSLEAAPAT